MRNAVEPDDPIDALEADATRLQSTRNSQKRFSNSAVRESIDDHADAACGFH